MFRLWAIGEWIEIWAAADKWFRLLTLPISAHCWIWLIKSISDAKVYDQSDAVFGR